MTNQTGSPTVIRAEEDESVNFVSHVEGGAFECRYVRRTPEYFIAYVSSQAGCDRSCRFCHLTATGQTSMRPAGLHEYARQIDTVLAHHSGQAVRPGRMNVNFMARGEPMLNEVLRSADAWRALRENAIRQGAAHGVDDVRFNVSTIMPSLPENMTHVRLDRVMPDPDTTIYYSLYSMDPRFRRRWLPKTVDPAAALRTLAAWQQSTGNDVVLHWAFIEGENDDDETIDTIVRAVRSSGLSPRFNAVRYNPFDTRRGAEPPREIVERNFTRLAEAFGDPASRIVPRVGFSAKASCGMFVDAA